MNSRRENDPSQWYDSTPPPLTHDPLWKVYDIEADLWSELPPMKTARNRHGMAAIGGKLIVAGGCGEMELPLLSVEAPGSWHVPLAPGMCP